jgi:hypothetical protein
MFNFFDQPIVEQTLTYSFPQTFFSCVDVTWQEFSYELFNFSRFNITSIESILFAGFDFLFYILLLVLLGFFG